MKSLVTAVMMTNGVFETIATDPGADKVFIDPASKRLAARSRKGRVPGRPPWPHSWPGHRSLAIASERSRAGRLFVQSELRRLAEEHRAGVGRYADRLNAVHLSAMGYPIWADAMLNTLIKMLAQDTAGSAAMAPELISRGVYSQ